MMDRFVVSAIVLGVLVLFASCSDDPGSPTVAPPSGEKFVTFVTGFASEGAATRVTGSSWEEGDGVGIFMLPHKNDDSAAAEFSEAYEENVLYTASIAGATTTLVADDRQILFPKGKDVNFVAYYPYRNTMHTTDAYSYPVNVATQSPHSAIDLLYYKGMGTAYNEQNKYVPLEFLHSLSKMVIHVVPATDEVEVDLTATTAALSGFPTKASFDLSDGTQSDVCTVAGITPVTNETEETMASFSAILVPHEGTGYERKITLNIEGKDYAYTLPESREQVSGVASSYIFKFTGTSIVLSYNYIVDWDGGQVAWGDYLLTTSKTQINIGGAASSGHQFTLATTAPATPTIELSNAPKEVTTEKPDWITNVKLTKTGTEDEWTSYTLTFDVTELTLSISDRTGYIHLSVEGLILVVKVVQLNIAFETEDDTTIDEWTDTDPNIDPEGTIDEGENVDPNVNTEGTIDEWGGTETQPKEGVEW